ncbi:MAG TPA: serine/threonine-protein kinase [Tepidisphaeraceae bacterium]|nr:serine/threonine-protein kinase [Tepidisphaeraceae bacterium]
MLTANQRISEYVLDAPIGAGTFGQVWRAHHHVWGDQLVAVKIPTDAQYVRNLQHEGTAIHGLIHPNIVRAIGFDPFADPAYLVMEYVPGTSLRTLIGQKKLTAADTVAIMKQVLAGLQYAHSRGIVHRDMKPENILIHERASKEGYGSEGVVKVTDFGLGSAVMTSAIGSIAYSASLNDPAAQKIAGTLDYMSPEQRTGGQVDARTDIYACGVILYEMFTGERPAGTELPSDLNKTVSGYLDDAFRRSYARLDKRFASAEEFSAALGAAPDAKAQVGKRVCPGCSRSVEAGDQFCMYCGRQIVSQIRRCPQCGAYPDHSDRFCIFCGKGLMGPVAAA